MLGVLPEAERSDETSIQRLSRAEGGRSMDAVRVRDDEHAEIELRIVIAIFDAWPNVVNVRSAEVYRPAGRPDRAGGAHARRDYRCGAGVRRGLFSENCIVECMPENGEDSSGRLQKLRAH